MAVAAGAAALLTSAAFADGIDASLSATADVFASIASTHSADVSSASSSARTNSDTRFSFDPSQPTGQNSDQKTKASKDESANAVPDFGSAGSWRWFVYAGGSAVYDNSPDDYYYNLHVGAEYFATKDFSIDFEVGGIYFDESGEMNHSNTGGANLNIMLRWYFLAKDTWAVYVDGGAGVLYTFGDSIPQGGSRFDFTPQAGFGVCFDLPGDSHARLFMGGRWHHISNSRLYGADQNPGRNSAMGYIGVSFPWGN